MLHWLWLIPTLPFAGFVILAIAGVRLPRRAVASIGVGSAGLSAAVALLVGADYAMRPPAGNAFVQPLWSWMKLGGFSPSISLYLDALSVVMILVVTVVGFFILLYSAEHMGREYGYSRFFAYMDLFVGSMLMLVLADNLLLLYLGWEGVGLCSYLLIGFWYQDIGNIRAANKAFIITRVGDTALAIGLILLFLQLDTISIREILTRAQAQWPRGSGAATWAALLLLGGAVGKSAQLPLQTWLPDAMAGPSPVSALIHAATMVTAGVYLIARTHGIFTLAPDVQLLVALVGAVTLLIAAASALVQWDIKRVLAWSTISQIGYMFLALGVGAWSAAIFHFLTHAFFKALLFLGAGVVITALADEHDLHRMGGLRRELPVTFWTFLAGAASLSALPFVTAGFYSKDLILRQAWGASPGGPLLWAAGMAGAFLTGLYTFRMVFLAFFGESKTPVIRKPGMAITVSLVVFALFSLVGGFLQLPALIAPVTVFSDFLAQSLPPAAAASLPRTSEIMLFLSALIVPVMGFAAAWWLFLREPGLPARIAQRPIGAALQRFLLAGWGFDHLYNTLFIRPFVCTAHLNREDFVDLIYGGLAWCSTQLSGRLVETQSGMIRRYAVGVLLGTVAALGLTLFFRELP
jgi:NADH-quinone oxidoreductase subunit L